MTPDLFNRLQESIEAIGLQSTMNLWNMVEYFLLEDKWK